MDDELNSLQQKVDQALAVVAKLEAEKTGLEQGTARRGATAKIAKLQRRIQIAKLNQGKAEKKLKDTLSLHGQTLPQTADDVQSEDTNVAEPTSMINIPPLDMVGEGMDPSSTVSNVAADSAAPPESAIDPQLLFTVSEPSLPLEPPTTSPQAVPETVGPLNAQLIAPGNPTVPASPSPRLSGQPSNTFKRIDSGEDDEGSAPDPPTVPASPSPRLSGQPSNTFKRIDSSEDDEGSAPDPPTVPALPSPRPSEQPSNTFKRIDRSDSEDDEGSLAKNGNMSLITTEDKTELQQQLFERRFSVAQPPKKRTKYVEVSNDTGSEGDPDIFVDEDDVKGSMEKAGPAKPEKQIKPPVAAQPMPRPTANDVQGSKEGTISKGKGRDAAEGGKRMRGTVSKGKEVLRTKDAPEVLGPKQGAKDKGTKEDYHASEFSVAKAARVSKTLADQRTRLANEVAHRQFAKDWVNARSKAERPPLPPGIDLVRFDPDYLPDVATADYDLAIELLFNNSNNYLCIPHVRLDRKLVSHIDNLEGPVKIRGIELPQNQNPNIKSEIPRPPKHFHCGCHEKVALAGFVMWKTWTAKTVINGQMVEEGLHKDKPFSPRQVLFILQFLKSMFGFTVKDMFIGSADDDEGRRKRAQLMRKVSDHCNYSHYELIGEIIPADERIPVLEEELEDEWI